LGGAFSEATTPDQPRQQPLGHRQINDRDPYTCGGILDLSLCAADALDMKRVGVVAVIVEPLVNQRGRLPQRVKPLAWQSRK